MSEVKKMKILTVTISDENHSRLEEIKSMLRLNNNAEAVKWMIEESHKQAVKQKLEEAKGGS